MGDKMNKMMLNLLIITWSLLCTCSTSSDVHKRMSTEQLRSIFHVDSHDSVPHYEVIHLTHHGTENHALSKRSISTSGSVTQMLNNPLNDDNISSKQRYHSHHVKKDLSKSTYYSDSKKKLSSTSKSLTNNLNSASISIQTNNNYENSLINNLNQTKLTQPQQTAANDKAVQQYEFNDHRQFIQSPPSTDYLSDEHKTIDDNMDEKIIAINNKNSDDKITNKTKNTKTFEHLNVSDIKEHNVSLSAFGDVFNLTLRPNEQLFKNGLNSLKMFAVNTNPNSTHGLDYEPIEEDSNEHIGEVFQDEQNMAAILMRRQLESGDLLMEGSIGSDVVIKPVPFGLINTDNGDNLRAHHIVYKRKAEPIVQLSDFAYMEPDRMQKRYRKKRSSENNPFSESHSRTRRAIPHIIYPEILVIVDYDGYRLHGGDNTQIKRYFVSFWNGVDLRYRLLKGPRIRISIAGIIISRGRDATPYLERNRVGRDAIDSAAALTDMGKYLFRERRLPVYDIAVAITKLDMCRRNYPTDVCNRGTAGFAYVGGACVVNKRLEKVNSVAIIEDTGGFSGIIVAAHEVGHLLGAVHDGSPPPSYLGGPGAEKCRWEDGYIMSDLRHTERGFRWSPCTIQSFHHFLNGDTASCLHNAPHEDDALGRALPGTLLSLDAQCRRDRGTSACFKDERVCAQLFCFDAASGYCVAYRPAAEGSPCGDGSHCLDGRCVAEHENIIPDYSQHTPSYVNPNAYQQQSLNTESYKYHADPMVTTSAPVPSSSPKPSPIFNNQFNLLQPEPNPIQSTDPFTPIYDEQNNIRRDPIESTTERFEPYHSDPIIHTSTTTTTTSERPTINPFYYGIHHTKISTRFPFKSFSTTKSPYNFDNFQNTYLNDKKTTSTVIPSYSSAILPESTSLHTSYESFTIKTNIISTKPPVPTTTKTPTTTTTTTTVQPPTHSSDTAAFIYSSEAPLSVYNAPPIISTTRNPVFDLYLKRLSSTTKSPYDFGNLGQYFKTTTQNPRYSNNLFGAHSNQFNSTLRLKENHQR